MKAPSAIVFAYSEVGVRGLARLLALGVRVPLLFTHEDDPRESQWFGSVAALAAQHGIRTVTPADPNTQEWIAEGRRLAPDFIFSFYYRYLLTPDWLAVPSRGALNMHGSLLPAYRGRAPVHWAILKGETQTGASLHYMVSKPDAGNLVDQEPVAIGENDDALAVSRRLAAAAQTVLDRAVPKLIAGIAASIPLDLSKGSYFGRRRPGDGRIDWRQGARQIHDLVRAVAPPFPGSFSDLPQGKLTIHRTRVDAGPAKFPERAPCLYHAQGGWYADCVDGRRLAVLDAQLDGVPLDAVGVADPAGAGSAAGSGGAADSADAHANFRRQPVPLE